ncbi:hypothetical protein RHGRI_004707 [Rhododendron griersonianum]|uniref:Uncharacterized protein n=1 Tax=Rhododendron griersonianum TaxID=479676 RepID=A0AAV6LC20_9ERIC|nr:hypothetical protein RHGRI_004707 [Rhododendron griersonianum]
MMSLESIPSAMPSPSLKRRRNEDDQIDFDRITGEEEELWSDYSENEENVDEVIKTKQSTNILDPEGLRRKGRPPCKRMQGVMGKAVKKKIEKKKKTLPNGKSKEVEEIVVDHVFGTQESVVNVNVRNFSFIAQFYESC